MTKAAPQAVSASSAVDVIAEELLCPLCGHDLRGLAEPRCPECGYTFIWEEIRDPARRLHPYLFEHHPERNVWSFIRTLVGGWRARRFWNRLTPQTPANPRRLLIYWIIGLALGFPAYLVALIGTARELQADNVAIRSLMIKQYNAMPAGQRAEELAKLQKLTGQPLSPFLDRSEPLFPDPRFFAAVVVEPVPKFIMSMAIAAALWPWVTVLVLRGSLWISLRHAKVRMVHLARCAIHTADLIAWYWLAMTAAVGYLFARSLRDGWAFHRNAIFGGGAVWVEQALTLMAVLLLVGLLLGMSRLAAALSRYLRLPHAWLVVVLTQFLVVFVTFVLHGVAILAISMVARWITWR